MARDIDKPNLTLPLAASYNARSGEAINNQNKDQRKLNSQYSVARNAATGGTTMYLSKRQGFKVSTQNIGVSTDVPYLVQVSPDQTDTSWIAAKNGVSTLIKTLAGTSTHITSHVSAFPVYFDKTFLTQQQYSVLQLYNASTVEWQTWYASTAATWFRVTSANFTGIGPVGKMEHIDGYAVQMTSTNRIYTSDVNSLSNWTAINFVTKTIEQDAARGLARYRNLVLAFGTETVEAYYNAGYATGSPLERVPQLASRTGLVTHQNDQLAKAPADGDRHYYATLDDRLYFVGRQGGAGPENRGIFMFDGRTFNRISTPFVEQAIRTNIPTHVGVLNTPGQSGIAFGFWGPNGGAGIQQWLMYFPRWNDWFEWSSYAVQPVSDGRSVIGMGGTVYANSIFKQTTDTTFQDGTAGAVTSYQFMHTFVLPTDGSYQQMRMFGVIGDTATTTLNLGVEFSDDDYQSFRTADPIDMTSEKKRIYRQGGFHQRVVRLTYTGALDVRLQKAISRIE